MREYKIAAIPGDGIGKEVIPAGLAVLEALAQRSGFRLRVEPFPWGSDYFRAHGRMMHENGLERLHGADAIFFGAVGDPGIPDHVTLWGLRLAICQGFDQYANVRPARILPGIASPLRQVGAGDLDWIIVRENSEGEYAGHGGRAHRGLPEEVATETAIFTRAGVARVMRFAFALARTRPRRHLTIVTKSNAQRHGMVLWDEIAAECAREFPDVTWDRELRRCDDDPHGAEAQDDRHRRRDQSSCRYPERPRRRARGLARHRADGEPQSRAALPVDVRADPRLRLRHRGQGHRQSHRHLLDRVADARASRRGRAAARLMAAIERVTTDPALHTPDLGGKATTAQVTAAVKDAIAGANA